MNARVTNIQQLANYDMFTHSGCESVSNMDDIRAVELFHLLYTQSTVNVMTCRQPSSLSSSSSLPSLI